MKYLLLFFPLLFVQSFLWSQNVGIGKTNPQVRLDVASTSSSPARFDGAAPMFIGLYEAGEYLGYLGSFSGDAPDIDLGTGFGNTEGKLHLTTGASPRLTIRPNGFVGINNTNPQWQLDVEGGMRLNGRFYINGTSGGAGQVFTAGGGVNKPSWQTLNTAFDNDTRFAVSIENTVTSSSTSNSRTVLYNSNSAAITSNSGGSITINQPGLYHFEGNFSLRISFNTQVFAETMFATMRFFVGTVSYDTHFFNGFNQDGFTVGWTGKQIAAWQKDVYISDVPTTISYGYTWGYNAGNSASINSRVLSGILSGYKISD